MKTHCSFCGAKPQSIKNIREKAIRIECKKCGTYDIDVESHLCFRESVYYDKRCRVVAIIKEMNAGQVIPAVGLTNFNGEQYLLSFDKLLGMHPESMAEKVDRILINVSKMSFRGKDFLTVMKKDYAFYYAENEGEMERVKAHLNENDLLIINSHTSDMLNDPGYQFSFFDDIRIGEAGREKIKRLMGRSFD